MDRGGQVSASGRGTVESRAGQLITTNPGEVHDGSPLAGLPRRWRMVHIEPAVLHAAIAAPDDHSAQVEITRPVIEDEALRHAVDRLFVRLGRASPPAGDKDEDDLAWDEALAFTCGLLASRHARAPIDSTPSIDVRRAMECLADRIVEPPSLDELARLVGTSRYQLVRRFARTFGLPPYTWLMQRRVEHARALILRGDPLVAVAAWSGFADQAHMTRAFVSRLGFTPGAWQRASHGA